MPRKHNDWEHQLQSPPLQGKPDMEALQTAVQRKLASNPHRSMNKARTMGFGAAAVGFLACCGVVGVVLYHNGQLRNRDQHLTGKQNSQTVSPARVTVSPAPELAVFDGTASYSASGYPLYSVVMNGRGDAVASTYKLIDHATWARYSPDGKWIAVVTQNANSANGQTSLWVMSCNGTDRTRIRNADFGFGAWIPKTDKFVYGSNYGSVLSIVKPGNRPQPYPVKLPQKAALLGIGFSPNGQYIVLHLSVQSSAAVFDELVIQGLSSDRQKILVQSNTSNGVILGPWSTDSQSVYWWLDPQHSASIAADGLLLNQTQLSGSSSRTTTSLVNAQLQFPQVIYRTVVPFGAVGAAIQGGPGRQVFENKEVDIWANGHIRKIPGQSGEVQLSPDVSTNGTLVTFTTAPASSSGARFPLEHFVSQLQLSIYNVSTHQVRTVKSAGTGVQTPMFAHKGQVVIYIQGSHVREIATNGTGKPKTMATLPAGLLQMEDFYG